MQPPTKSTERWQGKAEFMAQETLEDKQTNSDKVKIKKKIKRWGKANRRKETDRQHRQVKRRDADAEEGRKKGK